MELTSPVKVQPGTSMWTVVFSSFKSQLRCSATALTAALEALYAGLPGGFVIPCLLPVMIMAVDFEFAAFCTTGRKVLIP